MPLLLLRDEGTVTMAMSRDLILQQLQDHGSMSVRDLAVAAGVSPATAHRQLTRLEDMGIVIRTRGGAQIVRQESLAPPFEQRIGAAVEAKQAIAQQALQLVPVGGALFLDSSTTCLYAARAINRSIKREVTLVTNSPTILSEFSSPAARVIGTPGELDLSLRALGGPWTVEFLEGLNLDVAFISGFGMTIDGWLTTTKRLIVDVLQQAMRRSTAVYVLLDSTKLGRRGLLDIVDTHQAAGVIVDRGITGEQARHLRSRGVNVVVAS
jgi:DeoR/GlpR family transcriptional regulator of sugar metabolism